jgi:hypothetical protein
MFDKTHRVLDAHRAPLRGERSATADSESNHAGCARIQKGMSKGHPLFYSAVFVYEANCSCSTKRIAFWTPTGRPSGVSVFASGKYTNPSCRVRQNTKGDVQGASPFFSAVFVYEANCSCSTFFNPSCRLRTNSTQPPQSKKFTYTALDINNTLPSVETTSARSHSDSPVACNMMVVSIKPPLLT